MARNVLTAPRTQDCAAPVARVLGAGRPLDREARAYFEPRFGFDFGGIRIHTDAAAHRLAAAAGAHALTVGQDVVFARGAWGPDAGDGRERLAHELAHVVQAARHPVAAAGAAPGSVSDPGDPAEREAAQVAHQVAAGGSARVHAAPRAAIHRAPAQAPEQDKQSWLKMHEAAQLRVHELISDTLAVGAEELAKPPVVGALPPAPGSPEALAQRRKPTSVAPLAPDPHQQFFNTAEWISDKTGAGTLSFVILGPMHHPDKNGLRPYFDATVKYPHIGGDYPATAIDPSTPDPRIVWESPGTGGERSSRRGEIRLFIKGATNDDDLRRTLIHEVQHVADRHDQEVGRAAIAASDLRPAGEAQTQRDARLTKAVASASLWARYKSEFRAYWMQSATESDRGYAPLPASPFGQPNPDGVRFGTPYGPKPQSAEVKLPAKDKDACTPDKRTAGFASERQKTIFQYLITNDESYHFARPYVCDADFRSKVDGYTEPSGVNLVNSVRIDELSGKLAVCEKTMALTAGAVQALLTAADALDTVDRTFLRHPGQAQPFWDDAAGRLAPAVLTELRARVNGAPPAAPDPPGWAPRG